MEQLLSGTDGKLIAVEGIDGSGKTTLVSELVSHLRRDGEVMEISEPGDNPVGRCHRSLSQEEHTGAMCAALTSSADRWYKAYEVSGALDLGKSVVSDRYYLSGLAYHSADGIDFERYATLNEGVQKPDVYLYLDVPVEVARDRIGGARDRWEERLPRVAEEYEKAVEYLRSNEDATVGTIDATQSQEAVFEDALQALGRNS